ncbi:unannotated protein [freshwater metagenome]|uniref:Unannotated protein n=1 Tax=freshwater metagenome TaxID=449393 RepID=A0A6J7HFV8_9ZZZZ|nr:glycosyltransferase [Actinomycetota bacterium]
MSAVDVLLVSLGSTPGLRAADRELAGALERAGATVAVAAAAAPRPVRTFALTDLAWARAARAAAVEGIERHRPRTVLYSTTTAALLWPRPGAIRFDAPAATTRLGRDGIWQRPVERRRLREAPLLLPWSDQALAEVPPPHAPALVVPVPVEPAGVGAPWAAREIAAVTYAGNPQKKGLDRVLAAWALARRPGELLVVAGLDPASAPVSLPPGVELTGALSPSAYRELLLRARVYVTAPRREDHGIAQLEALADGCVLVTTPAPGPYVALAHARDLDPRLVTDDLAPAIRTALDDPAPGYQERAIELLAPLTRASIDTLVARDLVPRLLG